MEFYLQSGYNAKETVTISFYYGPKNIRYSKRYEYSGEIPVGSVEFCEGILGYSPRPQYFPEFLGKYINRKVWFSEKEPEEKCWVKPATRHKQWDSYVTGTKEPEEGPYWCSELVDFREEWRYYVGNGKVMAAHWYLGEEKEIDPPELDVDWGNFCGAVDFGRDSHGNIQLVENNLPYACGWYGSFNDGKIFGEWLSIGWNYVKHILK